MSGGKAPAIAEFRNGREACRWAPDGADGALVPTLRDGQTARLRRLASAFIPEGTTTDDYYGFQVWDSVQGLCSYVRGMLSSHAILTGVGVGSASATPGSAVFHFFLRDLSGMLGGVAFAMLNGGGLDSHAKQWRLFADVFNNVGYLLELASPLFPSAFLLLACAGSVARAITGVAAGATRAALTQHFAAGGNAADVSAKEGSQETAVTLAGMLLGMAVVHLARGAAAAVWAVFLGLTALHIHANARAMRSLRLTSLNEPRLRLLLARFAAGQGVPSVAEAAAQETLLAPPLARMLDAARGRRRPRIRLGARFSDLDAGGMAALLAASPAEHFCWRQGGDVLVLLPPGAPAGGLLRAYAAAWSLCRGTQPGASKQGQGGGGADALQGERWAAFERAAAAAGWQLRGLQLGDAGWRVAWGPALHAD